MINRASILTLCDRVMEYSLYLMVFYLPISKAIIEVCAVLAILAFAAKKIITREFVVYAYINKFLFFYAAVCALTIIFSSNLSISLKTFVLKLLENFLLYFIAIEVINSKRKIYTVLSIFMVSAALVCSDGLFQFFTHKDFLRNRAWPYSRDAFTFRIIGPFVTSNDLAAYLTPLTGMAFGLSMIRFKKLFLNILSKLLLVILIACLFLTLSRGAWIGAFFALLLLGFFVNKKKFVLTLLIMSLALVLLLQYLPEHKRQELGARFNFSDPGGRDRKALTKISLDMWSSRPVLGLGLGTYMYNFEEFNIDKKSYPWGPSYAHNCYLQILAETGLLGLASFLLLIVALFYSSIRRIKKLSMGLDKNIAVVILGGLLAYLVHSAFDTNLYSLDLGIFFFLLLALNQAQLKLSENNS